MTIRDFIRENRRELDRAIFSAMYRYDGKGGKGTIPADAKLNDKERHAWVLNDEGLYRWARSAGVKV